MRSPKAPCKRKATVGHQHRYLIQPADPPPGVPEGAVPIEALVFSPSPRPAGDILEGYCATRGLDVGRFRCRHVSFDRKNMRRDGRGKLRILDEDGRRLKARIDWDQ